MNRSRTPLPCSSATSLSSESRNSCMSVPTSTAGRCQFSLENANSVSAPILRRAHSSMHMRTGRTPSLWPAWRGRPRASAQRPLPSMMIAMCLGILTAGAAGCSHLHDFLFLGGELSVDVTDVLVGELLDVDLGLLLVVLRDQLFLERFLDVGDHVAAHVADRDARVLRVGTHHLGDVAAPFLGERRQRDADHGCGGDRVQTEVGL